MHNKYSTTENRIVRIKDDSLFDALDALARRNDIPLQNVFDAFCESIHPIAIRHMIRNTERVLGGLDEVSSD